ncbi:hypothetical protein BDV27DRAFT_137229 [Aspergillus caelatus]|uniref:Uncharacterized protein n=1 Tax=Aspergillus caelatus TaxID=61420 RepID=A0A5N6ZNF6_9EURO|nr:uncharacterized protein BDV27DRAFT_137229 [Aspergillus caelatus]KAE8358743.1 hypothetical protein BDV27DRAFT_137229 [Aspergillus caelatus]
MLPLLFSSILSSFNCIGSLFLFTPGFPSFEILFFIFFTYNLYNCTDQRRRSKKRTTKRQPPKNRKNRPSNLPSFFPTSLSPHYSQLVSSVLPNTFLRLLTVSICPSPLVHWLYVIVA